MTNARPRRCPRVQKTAERSPKQKTMDGKVISQGLGYLVETFSLNSADRSINRRGTVAQQTSEAASWLSSLSLGRKISVLDLQIVQQHFSVFVSLVNQVLERVYSLAERLTSVGNALVDNHGQGYGILRQQPYLAYKDNEEIRSQCFERMYRNILEQAARIVLSDWVRRELMASALSVLSTHDTATFRLMANRHIPPDLVRWVRKECPVVKGNGKGFYYSLSVLRQLRKALDEQVLNARGDFLGRRRQQRRRVRSSCRELGQSWTSAEGILNARASYVTHEVVPTRELASRSDPSAVPWEDRTPVSNFVHITMNGV